MQHAHKISINSFDLLKIAIDLFLSTPYPSALELLKNLLLSHHQPSFIFLTEIIHFALIYLLSLHHQVVHLFPFSQATVFLWPLTPFPICHSQHHQQAFSCSCFSELLSRHCFYSLILFRLPQVLTCKWKTNKQKKTYLTSLEFSCF